MEQHSLKDCPFRTCIHIDCIDFFKAISLENYEDILGAMMEHWNVGNDSCVPIHTIPDEYRDEYEPWEVIISDGLKTLNLPVDKEIYLNIFW